MAKDMGVVVKRNGGAGVRFGWEIWLGVLHKTAE